MNANLYSLFWEGFIVNSFSHPSANSLLIQLQPDAAVMPCCRRCERRVPVVHDVSFRRLLPIKHVAQLTGLHWYTVKNIDYRRLLRERTEPQRHTLRRLVMDEFALFPFGENRTA